MLSFQIFFSTWRNELIFLSLDFNIFKKVKTIFLVQRTDQVTSEENGTETKTIHAYSITQEGDPNTTHKLQMPGGTATFKPISTESQPSAEAKKEESNGDSSQERIEIIKSDLQNETVSNPILESVDANTDSDWFKKVNEFFGGALRKIVIFEDFVTQKSSFY
jgi:hypothetical protein